LASLVDEGEFKKQVKQHADLMKELFGVLSVFPNQLQHHPVGR